MEYISLENLSVTGIAVLIILDKIGILDKLLKRKNGNGISDKLNKIETNDLVHIEKKLDEMCEQLREMNEKQTESLFILRELR